VIDCTGRYVSLTEVRFAAHYGLNLDIGLGPKSANSGSRTCVESMRFKAAIYATLTLKTR
jgi:hypothetical protein